MGLLSRAKLPLWPARKERTRLDSRFLFSLFRYVYLLSSLSYIYFFLLTVVSPFFLIYSYLHLSICISEYGILLFGKAAVVPV